jgi:hypothetical protein
MRPNALPPKTYYFFKTMQSGEFQWQTLHDVGCRDMTYVWWIPFDSLNVAFYDDDLNIKERQHSSRHGNG